MGISLRKSFYFFALSLYFYHPACLLACIYYIFYNRMSYFYSKLSLLSLSYELQASGSVRTRKDISMSAEGLVSFGAVRRLFW
jgi:hypothetical protein